MLIFPSFPFECAYQDGSVCVSASSRLCCLSCPLDLNTAVAKEKPVLRLKLPVRKFWEVSAGSSQTVHDLIVEDTSVSSDFDQLDLTKRTRRVGVWMEDRAITIKNVRNRPHQLA